MFVSFLELHHLQHPIPSRYGIVHDIFSCMEGWSIWEMQLGMQCMVVTDMTLTSIGCTICIYLLPLNIGIVVGTQKTPSQAGIKDNPNIPNRNVIGRFQYFNGRFWRYIQLTGLSVRILLNSGVPPIIHFFVQHRDSQYPFIHHTQQKTWKESTWTPPESSSPMSSPSKSSIRINCSR